MSSAYGRLAAIRDYWMPRDTSARIEVRVTDLDEVLRELVRVITISAPQPAPAASSGVLLKLRAMADDSADRGDVFAQRVLRVLDAEPTAPAPAASGEPVAWVRVIDEALVCSHLDVADQADDYATAKRKLNNLLAHEQSIGAYFAAQPAPARVPAEPDALRGWVHARGHRITRAIGPDEVAMVYGMGFRDAERHHNIGTPAKEAPPTTQSHP